VLEGAQHVEATGSTLRFELPVSATVRLTPGQRAPVALVTGEAVTTPEGLTHIGFTIPGGPDAVTVAIDYRDIGSTPPPPLNQPPTS
jgi:hypothetical protein